MSTLKNLVHTVGVALRETWYFTYGCYRAGCNLARMVWESCSDIFVGALFSMGLMSKRMYWASVNRMGGTDGNTQ